jgi:hypothetical protein
VGKVKGGSTTSTLDELFYNNVTLRKQRKVEISDNKVEDTGEEKLTPKKSKIVMDDSESETETDVGRSAHITHIEGKRITSTWLKVLIKQS